MKKSELRQIIREEILSISEDDKANRLAKYKERHLQNIEKAKSMGWKGQGSAYDFMQKRKLSDKSMGPKGRTIRKPRTTGYDR